MLTFHRHRLASGMEVLAESNPDAHSLAVGFFVAAGSRDEPPAINGVSHFLEHMMFKGADGVTWEEVNRQFDEIGANCNAFTSQESTAYFANVLPEFTAPAVEQLSRLMRPALREEDFTTEKQVILEEIAMCQDDPGHRVYEALMREHFREHPLGQSVLGTTATIGTLSRRQMSDYFRAGYGPGNTIFVATGRLDFARIVELADKHFPRTAKTAVRHQPAPVPHFDRQDMIDKKLNRRYVMGMCPGPAGQDERRFAAHVLADVIGDDEGSRFYWALVDNAHAEEAEFVYQPHDGCGAFYLSMMTDPDRAEPVLKIAQDELRRVKSDLTDDEVERARNKIATSIVLDGESPMGRLRSIAGQWLYNREYRSLQTDLETLISVTPDSLRRLMEDFPLSPMTVVTLGPPASGVKTKPGRRRGK